MDSVSMIAVAIAVLACVIAFASFASYFQIWIRTTMAGAPIPLPQLILMKTRGTDLGIIANAHILLTQAGLNVPVDQLEVHSLAGGDVTFSARSLVAAHEQGDDVTWDDVAQADLAQRGDRPS